MLILSITVLSLGNCFSQTQLELWHGWMNLTPCTRMSLCPLPCVEYTDQEYHGYVYLTVPDNLIEYVRSECERCATATAVAWTIECVFAGSCSIDSFAAQWRGCIELSANDYTKTIINNTLRLETKTVCVGW